MLTSRSLAHTSSASTASRRICPASQLVQGVFVVMLSAQTLAQSSEQKLPPLTRVEQIRQLSPEEASKGYPVRIRGVVTMDAPAPDFLVQDATAGIYVEGSASPQFAHVLGEWVEVDGVTGPGKFAPVIRERGFRVLGRGTLPRSHLFAYADLADGQ